MVGCGQGTPYSQLKTRFFAFIFSVCLLVGLPLGVELNTASGASADAAGVAGPRPETDHDPKRNLISIPVEDPRGNLIQEALVDPGSRDLVAVGVGDEGKAFTIYAASGTYEQILQVIEKLRSETQNVPCFVEAFSEDGERVSGFPGMRKLAQRLWRKFQVKAPGVAGDSDLRHRNKHRHGFVSLNAKVTGMNRVLLGDAAKKETKIRLGLSITRGITNGFMGVFLLGFQILQANAMATPGLGSSEGWQNLLGLLADPKQAPFLLANGLFSGGMSFLFMKFADFFAASQNSDPIRRRLNISKESLVGFSLWLGWSQFIYSFQEIGYITPLTIIGSLTLGAFLGVPNIVQNAAGAVLMGVPSQGLPEVAATRIFLMRELDAIATKKLQKRVDGILDRYSDLELNDWDVATKKRFEHEFGYIFNADEREKFVSANVWVQLMMLELDEYRAMVEDFETRQKSMNEELRRATKAIVFKKRTHLLTRFDEVLGTAGYEERKSDFDMFDVLAGEWPISAEVVKQKVANARSALESEELSSARIKDIAQGLESATGFQTQLVSDKELQRARTNRNFALASISISAVAFCLMKLLDFTLSNGMKLGDVGFSTMLATGMVSLGGVQLIAMAEEWMQKRALNKKRDLIVEKVRELAKSQVAETPASMSCPEALGGAAAA